MPEPPPWPAPAAAGPLAGRVEIPGSKSLTNRSLLLAALADGPSRITGGLRARDTDLMISGLRALGVEVDVGAGGRKGGAGGKGGAAGKGGAGSKDRDRREDRDRGADKGGSGRPGDEDWTVTPGALAGPAHVDCGLAGTVMRFLPVIAGLAKGDIRFDGDPRARLRPMGALLSALEQLGIRVDDDGRNSLPFTVRGAGMIPGGEATIDASASSQYVSALLLSGARFDEGLTLRHVGPALPSLPHIEMSVVMLGESGVTVSQDVSNPAAASWRVSPGPIAAVDRRIEPDLSNAAPFLAAAMVTGGEVSIPGWPQQTTQAGDHLRQIFTEMGADVTLDDDGLRLRGPASIGGIDIDLRDVGELTPVIAAVAALADSPSRLRGIGHLRGHETDRLEALATEINALGGSVKAKANSLRIRPGRLRGGVWQTYEDHRMVMAGAVLGLRVANLQIADVDTVRKTLPDFVQRWESMLSGSAS